MVGKVVGEYRITEYIGSGGRGDVYKAQHLTLDLTVAIKFMRESLLADESAKKQFRRGAQALAALDHPSICRFYGAGEMPGGEVYVVMSFCEGESLHVRIGRGRFAVKEALDIVRDVASGLAHAHKRKVIHRDIKPANLMFDKDGVVKIVDFDLAKLRDSSMSSSGGTIGTPLYMAPEQLNGDYVDGRADVFALGDVLYEMLTGTPPFQAATLQTVMYRICNDYPKPLAELLPGVGDNLQQVINRALHKDPQVRYQTADEMRDNLQAVIDDKELEPQRRRRSKIKWIAAITSTAVAIAIGVWARWPHPVPPPPTIGVAVFAIDEQTGNQEDRALVNGLAHDLIDRVRVLATNDSLVWAVAPGRIVNVELRTPDKARDLLGANCAITVSTLPLSDRRWFQLQSYRVDSPAVQMENCQLDLSEQVNSDSIDVSLKRLIGTASFSLAGGYTSSADAYRSYLIGLGYLDSRPPELDLAVASLEQAVAADSIFSRAWAVLGEAYRLRLVNTKEPAWSTKAEGACRRGIELFGRLSDAFVTIGKLQEAQNQPNEAIGSYRAALAIDPRSNSALWKIADVHLAAGHDKEAEAAYVEATVANPEDASTYERLGYFYYSREQYSQAIAPFRRQSRLEPMYGQAYNYLGACFFARDCWDDAIAMFTRSFELGRSYVACANLGTLYYMNHEFENAARMYKWAYEYDASNYRVLGFLAAAYFWIPGEREHAKRLYARATALADSARNTAEDPYLLSVLSGYYAISDRDSAISAAERAIRLAPNDGEVLFEVAMTYEHIGEREKALLFLRRCIAKQYSLRHIEAEPFLTELRKDPRYELLTRGILRKDDPCGITD